MRDKKDKLANFFFEIGTLRKVARSHRQTLLTDDLSDNIASHTFRVAIIGYLLAKMENVDANKVLLMCLFHDIPEVRSGDQNWVHKKYVKVYEDEIINDQIRTLPYGEDISNIVNEYNARESKEAKIAKDADLLDQILLLKEYAHTGNKEASIWLKGKQQKKRITSKSAKKLASTIHTKDPNEWWINLWTSDNR